MLKNSLLKELAYCLGVSSVGTSILMTRSTSKSSYSNSWSLNLRRVVNRL